MNLKANLTYSFLLSLSHVLLPLVSIPYISRVLDPEGIGRVGFIDSFTYYFISIAEFGIVVYGMREVARLRNDVEKRAKLVSELLTLHVVSSACSLLLYIISVAFIWDKIQDSRLLLFSLSFLLVNFFACEWYFLGMEKFKYITIRSLITRLLGLASIFLLINEPPDYYIYYGIIAGSAIVNSVWNNVLLFRELKLQFRSNRWKKHAKDTRITYGISLVFGVTLMLDHVLLGLVSTAAAVGFYAFSIKIVRISSTMLSDSILVFFPRLVSLLEENNREEFERVILRNVQLIILFALPLCAGIFLLADLLVITFLGTQFIPAVDNLRILAIFPFLRTYNLFLSRQVLISHNKEKLYLKSLIVGATSFVLLTLILSYYFADAGACSALIISEIITLGMNYYYVKKTNSSLRIFDFKSSAQAILGLSFFVILIWYIEKNVHIDLLALICCILACIIWYIVFQVFIAKNEFMLVVKKTTMEFVSKKN